MEQLEIIMNTTSRLAKINQSLILLTKIDNNFYTEETDISVKNIINEKLDFFQDLIMEKKITVNTELDKQLDLRMNAYLADTLFLNIIKNAIMHNMYNGKINIISDGRFLKFINTGSMSDIKGNIFKRFIRSNNKDSLGIGLSIVKRICNFYSIDIIYSVNDLHEFKLDFKNES